jgi:hypothetical protein
VRLVNCPGVSYTMERVRGLESDLQRSEGTVEFVIHGVIIIFSLGSQIAIAAGYPQVFNGVDFDAGLAIQNIAVSTHRKPRDFEGRKS